MELSGLQCWIFNSEWNDLPIHSSLSQIKTKWPAAKLINKLVQNVVPNETVDHRTSQWRPTFAMTCQRISDSIQGVISYKTFVLRYVRSTVLMDLKEISWEGVHSTDLSQSRQKWRDLMNTILNLLIPENAKNILNNWRSTNFPRTLLHGVSYV